MILPIELVAEQFNFEVAFEERVEEHFEEKDGLSHYQNQVPILRRSGRIVDQKCEDFFPPRSRKTV